MYRVKVKQIAPINVVTKRPSAPNFEESGELNVVLFQTVRHHILDNGFGFAGYDIALYHGIPGQTELAIEAAIPVVGTLPIMAGVQQVDLADVPAMAYVIHYGGYETIHLAHAALQQWMQQQGFQLAGPTRDVYLVFDVAGDPAQYVTEIQYPVRKA